MANLTANPYDTLVNYDEEWNDTDPGLCTTSTPGSTATVQFNGTAIYVYGKTSSSTAFFTYKVDQEAPIGANLTNTTPNDQPFLSIQNLTSSPSSSHTLIITLNQGSLGLRQLTWYNNQASAPSGSPVNGTLSGNWSDIYTQNGQFAMTTNDTRSNITFGFQGTGIAVMGLRGPDQGSFSATLDGQDKGSIDVSTQTQHWAVLYRTDGLALKNHTLTLANNGQQNLTIGQAQIFGGSPPTPHSPTSSNSPSSTTTETTKPTLGLPVSKGLSTGGKAGLAIGILALVSLLAFAFLFWYRRRRASQRTHEKSEVTYARICSKCRKDIEGDYRLECVQPNCPADIDLHPECKDWNTPEHHDHEVHEVPNKS